MNPDLSQASPARLPGAHLRPGEQHGRWTILRFSHRTKRNAYFTCRCECGNVRNVRRWSLLSGHSKSCGCLLAEHRQAWAAKHAGVQYPPRTAPRPPRVRVTP